MPNNCTMAGWWKDAYAKYEHTEPLPRNSSFEAFKIFLIRFAGMQNNSTSAGWWEGTM